MGPAADPHTDNHNDDQIADLELQLAAHAARAAKLQARLMTTLDTLDSERRTYAEEISGERHQRVALQAQLRVARAERAAMEAERDSLRDGVLHLIEKVEVCNDYSLWPHSGLTTIRLADPAKSRHLSEQPQSTWTASARAYSSALITALREEYERERGAHSDSLRRLAELEAQLARRELELEERYGSAPVPPSDSPSPRLSRDGAIRVLQQSAARNEALTHEIAGLMQKLEGARAELEQTPCPSPVMTTPPRHHRTLSPVSPTPQRHPSPLPLPLHSPKSSSPISSHRSFSRSQSPPLLSQRVAMPPGDIARQIATVTQDLTGLRAEERRLLRARAQSPNALEDAPLVSTTAAKHTFRHVLLIEEECIRCTFTFPSLSDAPDRLTEMYVLSCRRLRAELAASTAREAALREMLGGVPASVTVPTEKDVFGSSEDDGEPMDLATPLQPTVLLDPRDL
ncbi:hypothetical protein BC826DRAFT_1186759 [Russula brevipes]|nr:hypothetical protein BC826DRAFT_1186759 [Russula brevipes]